MMSGETSDSFTDSLISTARHQKSVVGIHGVRGERRSFRGSGFFWAGVQGHPVRPGLVATNHHVVSDSTPREGLPEGERGEKLRFELELARNRRIPARVLIKDRLTDLAILEVDDGATRSPDADLPAGIPSRATDHSPRATRVLDFVRVGEPVLRIGSPGVAGAFDERLRPMKSSQNRIRDLVSFGIFGGREYPGSEVWTGTELLITDAGGSGGNSGGPVIAIRDGAVVGITVGSAYRHAGNPLTNLIQALMEVLGTSGEVVDRFLNDPVIGQWLSLMRPTLDWAGHEIPAFWLDHLWREYEATGGSIDYLKRGSLGFENEMETFTRAQVPAELDTNNRGQETAILLADFPEADSPAAAAGLRKGDLVLSFDGIPVEDPSGLIAALTRETIGRECEMVVYRTNNIETLRVIPTLHEPRRFDRVARPD